MDDKANDFDLPMLSNWGDIKVAHFILDTTCIFNKNIFDCNITCFSWIQLNQPHSFILDCHSLDVTECFLYELSNDEIDCLVTLYKHGQQTFCKGEAGVKTYKQLHQKLLQNNQSFHRLDFEVDKHCIKIILPEPHHGELEWIPLVFNIKYRTQPAGPCLLWAPTQDYGNECVFTAGHLLNNRSFFPAQDTPEALSTWHFSIRLTDLPNCTSGDWVALAAGTMDNDGWVLNHDAPVFHFFNDILMPASTFAMAVGCWNCVSITVKESLSRVSCRLFTPYCLSAKAKRKLEPYIPQSFQAAESILGPYPLRHLDILVVPKNFDSLGMASPCLTFLSQSILTGEDSIMLTRVSHELCHTWFGIISGPKDWTEEWLTEGVCSYLEDIIHARIMGWEDKVAKERLQLRSLLKMRLLKAEVSNTSEDLQTLRPNKGIEVVPDVEHVIKNGLNPDKTLVQVHYLKGFFLLQKLEQIAGQKEFLIAIKNFINKHFGILFSSKEFLESLIQQCPSLGCSKITADQICEQWLDSPGLPLELTQSEVPLQKSESSLVQNTLTQLIKVKKFISRKRSYIDSAAHKTTDTIFEFVDLLPEQVVLLLEILLEENISLQISHMASLHKYCGIKHANAEVLHAWCELVITQRAEPWYRDIEHFLLENQALGVYLYGELMISELRTLQDLAKKCFQMSSPNMPQSVRQAVSEMINPV